MRNSLTAALLAIFTACSGRDPSNVGITSEGRFSECPSSPNCVSSQARDKMHYIDPIKYNGSVESAYNKIIKIVESTKRTEIKEKKRMYIHAEYTSAFFRFVDDVEFYFNEKKKVVDVRSASRIGKGDFGVNRKRIESLREAFNKE